MRIIIYTGKGGVGKTSISAATGVKLAAKGVRTLVISTDLAHSLRDSFGQDIAYYPVQIKENLYAMELNPQSQLEEKWDNIYNYMVDFFKIVGLKDVFAEELTLFPGIEELFCLLEIHDKYLEGAYDALVLDFPPTASTIRLLSFFDVIGWYMERFFKIKRRSIKFIRTFKDSFMDIPLPEDDVFAAFEEIYNRMAETKKILSDFDTTTVRLVMNPEEMVINESQRTYTYLNLYGFNVDAVIVNKLLPGESKDPFYHGIIKRQQENLQTIKNLFSPLKIYTLSLIGAELKGLKNLQNVAEKLYGGENPLDGFHSLVPISMEKEREGYSFKVYMPFLSRDNFQLHQKGGVLIIKVGTYKQKLQLPQVLSNKSVKKAKYSEGFLKLHF